MSTDSQCYKKKENVLLIVFQNILSFLTLMTDWSLKHPGWDSPWIASYFDVLLPNECILTCALIPTIWMRKWNGVSDIFLRLSWINGDNLMRKTSNQVRFYREHKAGVGSIFWASLGKDSILTFQHSVLKVVWEETGLLYLLMAQFSSFKECSSWWESLISHRCYMEDFNSGEQGLNVDF